METEAEFSLPISAYLSMNDLPGDLKPIEDHPNIYKFSIGDDQYILKTYPDEEELTKNLLKVSQFFNEAAIQSSIPHPNILHIIGIILIDHNKFKPGIITKECQYNDLRNFIDTESQLPQEEKILDPTIKTFFSLAIIDALSELHSLNLIHGDIKPDNIFIDSIEIIHLMPLLADFGSSRLIDKNVNIFSGTKFYRSPETMQTNNNNNDLIIGKPSDIFSLGMTLLNLAKDESEISSIFELSSDSNITDEKILEAYKRIPEILSKNKEDPINDVIIKCCDFDPLKRPTAPELFEKMKNGQFFKGCDIEELNGFIKFVECLKENMKNEMNVDNIVRRFATLAESQNLMSKFENLDNQKFGKIMSVLLEFATPEDYEELDDDSKALIDAFNSRKDKKTGLEILEIVYYLCKKLNPSPELIQFFISKEDNTLSMDSQQSALKFDPKMIFQSNGINDKKFLDMAPKMHKAADKISLGSVKIDAFRYDRKNKLLSYHVATQKQVPYKMVKIRPKENKITFKV